MNRLLVLWQRLSKTSAGRWLFSRLICWKAPYFATIRPRFERLEPGRCELKVVKRRAVLNHIGTVHAIAMCNMAELAAGTATEVTIPTPYRWIPKGMTVEYLHKATSDLYATAIVALTEPASVGIELPVPVEIVDKTGVVVFRASVRMWVSPKTR